MKKVLIGILLGFIFSLMASCSNDLEEITTSEEVVLNGGGDGQQDECKSNNCP